MRNSCLGEIEWLSGLNQGKKMEVKEHTSKQITLALAMAHEISFGDKFKITAGCDKVFSTCCEKFNNAINFRGEPHLSGMDKILATSTTASDIER